MTVSPDIDYILGKCRVSALCVRQSLLLLKLFFFGGIIMKRNVESMKNRIDVLQGRDAIGNQRIINKIKRRVRASEKEAGQK